MEFLLLDVGSSFIKYSFYDNGKRANSEIYAVPFPKPLVDDGVRYEVDRALLDEAFLHIVDEAAERECTAAVISVQMHGYLLKHGGEFSNYISWKDRRGLAVAEGSEKRDLYENGTVMKANLPRASLMTYPALVGREFFTLGSYLAYRRSPTPAPPAFSLPTAARPTVRSRGLRSPWRHGRSPPAAAIRGWRYIPRWATTR